MIKYMKILAIETSCDDTGIAVIKASGNKKPVFDIAANIVSSQIEVHKKWGGVYPTLAKREHQKNLVPTLEKALKEASILKNPNSQFLIPNQIQIPKFKKLKEILNREEILYGQLKNFLMKYEKPDAEGPDGGGIDAIAVTIGPGLEPCLWVGVNFARALSYFWNLPIIPVNHVEAHIFANFVGKIQNSKTKSQNFPAICLVVSGGHTQLILMKDFGKYEILGETKDDAAGECFDKVAKILGLGYPGGPVIAALAEKASKLKVTEDSPPQPCGGLSSAKLPRPMIHTKDYAFSFSGLKTAVLYNFKSQSPQTRKSKKYIMEICAETQQAIIDVLIKKTIKAAKDFRAKSVILGGGVSANKELRKQMAKKIKKEFPDANYLAPEPKYSTDNAAMIGVAAYYNWLKNPPTSLREVRRVRIKAEANLRIK